MKKFILQTSICLCIAVFSVAAIYSQGIKTSNRNKTDWWNENSIPSYSIKENVSTLSFIKVDGNKFIN
ncbi:MAG: hypothetical protein JXJ22_14385 [Bacteroidales bacterium]|nr:hypothetical protein [Bacteroidales bacterium]